MTAGEGELPAPLKERGIETFRKDLVEGIQNYEPPRTKRAHTEYPGEHVLFHGNEIIAHGRDKRSAFASCHKLKLRGSFMFHVTPEGKDQEERKYVSRPHGRK